MLGAFLDEAGRAEELPAWVFRLWASGNEWNTQRIVLDRMDRHRDLDIPVGAVVIEAWSDEEGIMIPRDAGYAPRADGSPFKDADFSYPADGAWPDPKGMVAELHDRDIKVLLWQIPLLKTATPSPACTRRCWPRARRWSRGGHAVLEADGTPYLNRGWWFPKSLLPDLSTAATRDWWTAKRALPRTRSGTSTASRPTAANTPGGTTCATATAARGRRGQQPLPGALRAGVRRPAARRTARRR